MPSFVCVVRRGGGTPPAMSLRRRVLVIACVALSAAPPVGCGGADETEPAAAQILRQTVRSSASAIEDGYLSLSFRLDPRGSGAVGEPVLVTLLGPFRGAAAAGLGRFDVEFAATVAQRDHVARVVSTGTRVLMTLDGATYALGGVPRRSRTGLPVTGLDPLRWIRGARRKRDERAVGVQTIRIGGTVDVQRMLTDFDALFARTGGAEPGPALLSPQLRRQIAGAVESSSIDVWTGASDKLLRQISATIVFSSEPRFRHTLTGGRIDVHLRLDDVNRHRAPAAAFTAPTDRARALADRTTDSPGDLLKQAGDRLSRPASRRGR